MLSRVLFYSSLFPSPSRPIQGLFVAGLAKALAASVQVRVVQPVIAHLNPREIWGGRRRYLYDRTIPVEAPLCFNVPHFLKGTDAGLMALGSRGAFHRAFEGRAELVHAHFAYPDGVAAAMLARRDGLPLVVTVHGSDINVLAHSPARRQQIQRVLQGTCAVVAVAKDLVHKVVDLGVPPDRVHHIPNGVDLAKFFPGNKAEARARLSLPVTGRIVLAVGGLVPVKAYDRLIRAFSYLEPGTSLMLVGDGPEREALARLVHKLGLVDRVSLVGAVLHDSLVHYYCAADLLAISSHSEGWPTVIHESLACGTPIVANPVGGIPEALATPGVGLLTSGNGEEEMAKGIKEALSTHWNAVVLEAVARAHSWQDVAKQYLGVYEGVLRQRDREFQVRCRIG
jgi:glycosyltransferase involved in cell wall biosynthesis